jgi:uncharacterized repeat protein (TIGR04138 family)
METPLPLIKAVDRIRQKYSLYRRGAYFFVHAAVAYTSRELKRPSHIHITAKDLLEGLQKMALELYGPMAREVLHYWNIVSCQDFGVIVEHLVEFGILNKSPSDTYQDFTDHGFDFKKAFPP